MRTVIPISMIKHVRTFRLGRYCRNHRPPGAGSDDTYRYILAEGVAEVIFARGLAGGPGPSGLRAFIRSQTHKAEYQALV